MKIITNLNKIKEVLERGVDEVIVKVNLEKNMKSGKKLRIKFGIDPTAPDLHLGHSVPLRKLKQFQDLGHQIILLIGDFTGMIGDPSGRTTVRKLLTTKQIKRNMRDYIKQASRILNIKKTEIRYNGEWFNKKRADFFFELSSRFTVARVMERDDFKKRLKEDVDINVLEIMYPLMQGYDSVMLKADVEIGGTDQKFNLLMGRKVQKRYDQPQQNIITTPLLEGTDGILKMSKTYNNWVGLTEKSEKMYGKIMSIPDQLLWKYFKLLTDVLLKEIEDMRDKARRREINPRDAKAHLAREIVSIYHSKSAAIKAEREFNRVFKEKKVPTRIPTIKISGKPDIVNLIIKAKLASSKSEAKRLIIQNAVKIDNKTIKDWKQKITPKKGAIFKVGKKRFIKLI